MLCVSNLPVPTLQIREAMNKIHEAGRLFLGFRVSRLNKKMVEHVMILWQRQWQAGSGSLRMTARMDSDTDNVPIL